MARPRKWRNVCELPGITRFGPLGLGPHRDRGRTTMTVDEYETIRLIDLEGFTQELCSKQMNIARTTVQNIYAKARQKIADSLVNGKVLIIEGGDYQLCNDKVKGCGIGCHSQLRGNRHGHARPLVKGFPNKSKNNI